MRTTTTRSKLTLLFMAFAMLLALPATAFADTLSDTNDDLETNAGGLDLGDIKAGETKTGSVPLVVDCVGKNHASPGALQFDPVGKALNSDSKGSPAEVSVTPSVTIPNTWPADGTGCPDNTTRAVGEANVSVTAGTELGSRSVKITISTPRDITDVSGTTNFHVTYNVVANNTGGTDSTDSNLDTDGDSVADSSDNCPNAANPNQDDADADDVGDVCDPDSTPPVITSDIQGTLGNNGWYTSDVSVDWTVSDNESNESSISKSDGCNNFSVTSDQGETTYTCSATSGGGTNSESVTIKRDATAPSKPNASFDRAPEDSVGGFFKDTVTVSYSGSTDALSGIKSQPKDETFNTTDSHNYRGFAVDNAGNVSEAASGQVKVDADAPVVDPASVVNSVWRNSDLSQSFRATDAGSGLNESGLATDGSLTFNLTASAESQSANSPTVATRTVSDKVGHSVTRSVSALIDLSAPVITAGQASGMAGLNGWYTDTVTQPFSASDALSGLADDSQASFPRDSGAAEGSAVEINSGTVSDVAGNANPGVNAGPFKIDLSDPVLNVSGAANGATFNVCDAGLPAKPSFAPADAISGLDGSQADSWTTPSAASGVGTYTYQANAKDVAGRKASETRTYAKTYGGAFGGVTQPINGGSTATLTDDDSRFKLGSTVPVKFRMTCGTTPIDNAVAKLNVKKADGTPDPGVDEAVSTAASTTGNLFRYDATSGQYIFNLSTKNTYLNANGTSISFAAGTYTLSILLDDGSYRSVNVNIVK